METTELKNNIKKTAWAKRFKKKAAIISDLVVDIYKTDEYKNLWVVVPEIEPDFWLDCFKKRSDAVALCKKMNWRIIE